MMFMVIMKIMKTIKEELLEMRQEKWDHLQLKPMNQIKDRLVLGIKMNLGLQPTGLLGCLEVTVFVDKTNGFNGRGGGMNRGISSGIFAFGYGSGESSDLSFRIVLTNGGENK